MCVGGLTSASITLALVGAAWSYVMLWAVYYGSQGIEGWSRDKRYYIIKEYSQRSIVVISPERWSPENEIFTTTHMLMADVVIRTDGVLLKNRYGTTLID